MKNFDLEKAKAGYPVRTRDGHEARIICFDRENDNPIVALIKKRVITKPNGSTITVSTPMVTPAGQLHILNKFLEYYSKM